MTATIARPLPVTHLKDERCAYTLCGIPTDRVRNYAYFAPDSWITCGRCRRTRAFKGDGS